MGVPVAHFTSICIFREYQQVLQKKRKAEKRPSPTKPPAPKKSPAKGTSTKKKWQALPVLSTAKRKAPKDKNPDESKTGPAKGTWAKKVMPVPNLSACKYNVWGCFCAGKELAPG